MSLKFNKNERESGNGKQGCDNSDIPLHRRIDANDIHFVTFGFIQLCICHGIYVGGN